jgi:hypothetical protein
MKKLTPTDQQTPFAVHSKESANDPVSTKEIHTIENPHGECARHSTRGCQD